MHLAASVCLSVHQFVYALMAKQVLSKEYQKVNCPSPKGSYADNVVDLVDRLF